MAGAPVQAVPFLQERLRPVAAADPQRVEVVVAALKDFKAREQASRELETLGAAAAVVLQEKLAAKPPLEVAQRIEILLGKARRLDAKQLQVLRAVQALEHAGNLQASSARETSSGSSHRSAHGASQGGPGTVEQTIGGAAVI